MIPSNFGEVILVVQMAWVIHQGHFNAPALFHVEVSPSMTWFSSATRPRLSLLARQLALVSFVEK